MVLLAPFFLYAGLGLAAAAIALHFIVTRQPRSNPLPTARFVPEGSVQVTTLAAPTHRRLLLLRVLLALAIGAAFAKPVLSPGRRPVARIVVADLSSAVASIEPVRDSVRALLADGDGLVVFDSTARAIGGAVSDSVAALQRSKRDGHLSAAIIVALRSASRMRAQADSFELVIVSPLRTTELDGATDSIRQLWPGRIRLVPVPAVTDSSPRPRGFTVRAPSDDPVAVAAGLAGSRQDPAVRIVRDTPTMADSTWAARAGHTLVRWPQDAPPGWVVRGPIDTVGAVVAGSAALVSPMERRWQLDSAARPSRVAARWVDGVPAAVEYHAGEAGGCIRDVAIPVLARGDVVLRPSFGRLLDALGAPCAGGHNSPGIDESARRALAGTGALAAAASIPRSETIESPLVPWLLALAFVLAAAEIFVRRGKA